ncbi:hypothetical protein AAGN88_24120, partial [Klebsiella pneumoniae]
KSAQIREILISESAWEEMTCLFAPSLALNQIISIYLTGSGMAIISRITPLYFYRHPLSR